MKNDFIDSKQDQSTYRDCETEIRVLKGLLRKVSAHAEKMAEELNTADREVNQLRHQLFQSQSALKNLYASRSWKITLPVRLFSRAAKRILYFLSPFHQAPGGDENPAPGITSPAPPKTAGQQGGLRNEKARQRSIHRNLTPLEAETYKQLTELINGERNRK